MWTGHAQNQTHYRDSGLRIEGPLVNRMQGAFSENWIEETGEVPAGEKYFPHLGAVGPTPAQIAYTSPSGSVSSVQVLYYLAIKAARHEIIIQNPYLLPDRNAIDALADAVHRGVDVKVMVPATSSTDNPIVQHASHHHFGTLLRRGVKVYEYKRTLLHQKTIVVDGIWSCIGSTNFDDRSFQLNDEVSVAVLDRNIAQQLRAAFADDLRDAEQRHFDEWSHRSLWWLDRMVRTQRPLEEKLTLFWHDHFATADQDTPLMLAQICGVPKLCPAVQPAGKPPLGAPSSPHDNATQTSPNTDVT